MRVKLTDRYVVLQTGLVSRHTSTVMLNRVESLDVDQSLWQRMTGYGTLTIRGTGSEDLRLAGIADPVGFQTEARKGINAAGGAPLGASSDRVRGRVVEILDEARVRAGCPAQLLAGQRVRRRIGDARE